MTTPLGNNPIAEHAASEARHDKPLPGHVRGLPPLQIGDVAAPAPSSGGFNTAYAGPGVPMPMAKPIASFFFYSWMYLTAPVKPRCTRSLGPPVWWVLHWAICSRARSGAVMT